MQSDEKYSRILESAIDLVGEYGYRGTTTKRIAKRAGVNEVTVFRKFGSKQQLFEKGVLYVQSQISEKIEGETIEITGNFVNDLSRLVLSLMEIMASNREAIIAILFEAKRENIARRAGNSMVSFVMNLLKGFLDKYSERGYLKPEEVETVLISLLSFIFARILLRERILGGLNPENQRELDFRNFTQLIICGIPEIKNSQSREGKVGRNEN